MSLESAISSLSLIWSIKKLFFDIESLTIAAIGSMSFCFERGFPALTFRLKWIARCGIIKTGLAKSINFVIGRAGFCGLRTMTLPASDNGRSNQV
jgi:hypothetical protein